MIREQLDRLVGTWNTRGVVKDDGAKIVGTDRYEWLGEAFLVHHVDVTMGGAAQRTIEIFALRDDGFDMTAYNQDGSIETMRGTFDEDGVYRAGNDHVRATLTIEASAMTALWEKHEGGTWTPWIDMSFTRSRT